jgi:ribosomal protein L37AE/L43A
MEGYRTQDERWFCPTHGLACSQSRGSDGIWRCAPGGHNLIGYVPTAQLRGAVERVAQLEAERQVVLDCVNLYGDETLHAALDAIGLATTSSGGR